MLFEVPIIHNSNHEFSPINSNNKCPWLTGQPLQRGHASTVMMCMACSKERAATGHSTGWCGCLWARWDLTLAFCSLPQKNKSWLWFAWVWFQSDEYHTVCLLEELSKKQSCLGNLSFISCRISTEATCGTEGLCKTCQTLRAADTFVWNSWEVSEEGVSADERAMHNVS